MLNSLDPRTYNLGGDGGQVQSATPSHMTRADAADAVRYATAGLSARQRQVIQMYYWRGMPVDEVAGQLGLSLVAIYKCLQRARAAMRGRLERAGVEHG